MKPKILRILVLLAIHGPLLFATLEAEPAYYTTAAGKLLAPTWDWHWHSSMSEWTHDSLREVIRREKDMGFRRLYIVADLPGGPVFSSPATAPALGSFKQKNHENLGPDLNAALAKACREEGMEVIAIFKPYENGGSLSIPSGSAPEESGFRENGIGGDNLFFDTFASAHPEMRVARKNDHDTDDHTLPITRIEAEFMLDPYQASYTADGYAIAQGEKGYMTANIVSTSAPTPKVHLLVSRDNCEYIPYPGEFSYEYKLERRDIRNVNGIVIGENKRCNVLVLTGLNIGPEYPYVALVLENSFSMRTIPYSMIHWFSGSKELKLTATSYVRNMRGASDEWTKQDVPCQSFSNYNLLFNLGDDGRVNVTTKDGDSLSTQDTVVSQFQKNGFFFSWYGIGHNGDGWKISPVFGLARGKAPYMGGALCEAYPEVRQYWLDTVRQLLDAGFDGVDVRLQSHSSMVTDYMSYGFNAPLTARYQELYKENPNEIPMSREVYLRLMKLRGDYFMEFLEDASKLTKERGAKFIIHLRDAYENPICDSDWNQLCHWTMPKISLDWKRCVDLSSEITIKDYYYKKYKPDLAKRTKDYASSLGKRVWVNCHHEQGDGYDEAFLRTIEKDDRISGILLYDTVSPNIDPQTKAMLEKFGYKAPDPDLSKLSTDEILSFALSEHSSISANGSLAHLPQVGINEDGVLQMSFTAQRPNLRYEVQQSSDLRIWETIQSIITEQAGRSVVVPSIRNSSDRLFLRLRISPVY